MALASPTAPWLPLQIRGKEKCLCKVCPLGRAQGSADPSAAIANLLPVSPLSCRGSWSSGFDFQPACPADTSF